MRKRKFNKKLSLAIDAAHAALQQVQSLPNSPLKIRKLLILRKRLNELERRI